MNRSIIILLATLTLFSLSSALKHITPQEGDIFDLQQIDKDADRLVAYEEFKEYILTLQMLEDHYTNEEIDDLTFEAFQLFDTNSDGMLEDEEYRAMVKHVGNIKQDYSQRSDVKVPGGRHNE